MWFYEYIYLLGAPVNGREPLKFCFFLRNKIKEKEKSSKMILVELSGIEPLTS